MDFERVLSCFNIISRATVERSTEIFLVKVVADKAKAASKNEQILIYSFPVSVVKAPLSRSKNKSQGDPEFVNLAAAIHEFSTGHASTTSIRE